MSIAQKSLAIIAVLAVAVAVVFSFYSTLQVASAATVCPHTFSTNLTIGSTGADVMALQQLLNSDSATMVASTGVGSPGMETSYFGGLTKAAVIRFQQKYTSQVLTPVGLTAGTGFFGASSRAQANALCSGTVSGPGPTPVPTGTGLSVTAGTQPANSLAPKGASRVPFTRFMLTAGNDGDVVVSSVTVQRTGLGSDSDFAGVILIDESTGAQLGTAKTFNSNHQATIGNSFVIPRGTTKSFLVAGNMDATLTNHSGEAPSIAVVAINTSAVVSGSLPITGATQTTNNTLAVGTMDLDVSNAYATNAPSTQSIGTTGYKFTGFRLTAGSAEDVSLKSITFEQSGSASSADLSNVTIAVNGTSYPTMLSTDGRYYMATLGSGVIIPKGNSVDVYVQADISGSNASGRTIDFDVDKTTDIYGIGQTYGYGVSPTTSGGTTVPTTRTNQVTVETTGTPYIYGSEVLVNGASVTTIGKSNSVASQNIAINVSGQPLGGFQVNLTGEAVTVQGMTFTVNGVDSTHGLTNVSIVDENGSVVAGPVDETSITSTTGSLVFNDSVTFPAGNHTYTLRGKVASGTADATTIVLSTDPSSWSNPKGNTTGNSISLAGLSSFSMNTMTVQAGQMIVSDANSPATQTTVAGGTTVLMANFQFDASQSGEDVRFSSVPLKLVVSGAGSNYNLLSSCQLYNGATPVSNGSSGVLNPAAVSLGATTTPYTGTISLTQPVTVTKGTVTTLGLRCSISGSTQSGVKFQWGISGANAPTATGATSGTNVTVTNNSSTDTSLTLGTDITGGTAPIFTIGSSSVSVTNDASTPGYTIAAAGTTGITGAAYLFQATNEDVNLQKIGLVLDSATSTAGDLVRATIWDGSNQVGSAYFTGQTIVIGSNTYQMATSTLTSTVTIPANSTKTLTIKLDLANVGTNQSVAFSGHLVKVDYLNGQGVGVSGTTVYPTGTTSVSGIRVMKSYPVVALDTTLSSSGVSDGRLMRFMVTASTAGPISIAQFGLNISTSSARVTDITIYGFTDSSYSQPISGVQSSGDLQNTDDCLTGTGCAGDTQNVTVSVANGSSAATVQVPAGTTRYFEVRGTVTPLDTSYSVVTKLLGSSSFPSTGATVNQNPLLQATSGSLSSTAMIWSPNSTTTPTQNSQDWTNGFNVQGLPSGGLISSRTN